MDPFLIALYASVGFGAGVVAGLFGVGGGIILTPMLYFSFGLLGRPASTKMTVAVATSLTIIIVNGASAAAAHIRRGHNTLAEAGPIAAGGAIGAGIAAMIAANLPAESIRRVFGVFMVVVAFRFIFGGKQSAADATTSVDQKIAPPAGMFIAGIAAGLIAGALGVGGGVLAVPALIIIWKAPYLRAVGVSSAMVSACAFAGAAAYIYAGLGRPDLPPISLGYLDPIAALIIAPLGLVGASLGARISTKLNPLRLKQVFALLVLVVGIKMIF